MVGSETTPVYTIGIAAKLLGVCSATLRIWERKGLVKPARLGKNRYYSKCDLERLERVRTLLQKQHINIEGAKSILFSEKCWEIKSCNMAVRETCPVYLQYNRA